MEELLRQLLQESAMAKTAEASAKHQAVTQQLQTQRYARQRAKLANAGAPVSERQGFQDADVRAAGAVNSKDTDRGSVISDAASGLTAMPAQPTMFAGMSPEEISRAVAIAQEDMASAQAYQREVDQTRFTDKVAKGAADRESAALGRQVLTDEALWPKDRGADPWERSQPHKPADPNFDMDAAAATDAFVQKYNGYDPRIFEGMDQMQAFDVIQQQLQARRRALGDQFAFGIGPSM